MTSSAAVEADDFGLWEPTTSRDEQLPNRGATWKKKAKRIRPFCFIFFHDFHGVFHGAHMRRRVWRLTATKIWPTTGNITAWQENVTWFDKRKLWRLETKHYVFPTKHNDDVLHMLNKRNVHFDHNNGWFVHFDQNFGWSANQVWLWIHLVMPLDVDAESLPTFQLFHDEESNIVQHFFQTWYILKYLEIYVENTMFDSKTCFLFVFFSFSCFWFCDLACRARFGILGCEASTAIQVTTKKHAHTFSSLATSWFPRCSKILSREKHCLYMLIHVYTIPVLLAFVSDYKIRERQKERTPRSHCHVPRDTVAPAEEVTLGGQRRCNIPPRRTFVFKSTLRSHKSFFMS